MATSVVMERRRRSDWHGRPLPSHCPPTAPPPSPPIAHRPFGERAHGHMPMLHAHARVGSTSCIGDRALTRGRRHCSLPLSLCVFAPLHSLKRRKDVAHEPGPCHCSAHAAIGGTASRARLRPAADRRRVRVIDGVMCLLVRPLVRAQALQQPVQGHHRSRFPHQGDHDRTKQSKGTRATDSMTASEHGTHTLSFPVFLLFPFLPQDDKLVTLQIWDTAGQERFQSLGVAFYRGAGQWKREVHGMVSVCSGCYVWCGAVADGRSLFSVSRLVRAGARHHRLQVVRQPRELDGSAKRTNKVARAVRWLGDSEEMR